MAPSSTQSWLHAMLDPTIRESVDAEPLATTVGAFFYDFPYHRLPDNPYLAFFLRPDGLAALVALYLVSKPVVRSIPVSPKSAAFRNFVAVHNLALAVFSAVVVVKSWPIVVRHTFKYGAYDTYCDPDGRLWVGSNFGTWAVVFYLSKFYEFVDTWILIWKNKQPSFLQVYHHTGVAFCLWACVVSQCSSLTFFVLLNSVIHTLMYTYFFIKTVRPTAEIKAAKYLTMMQIGQFIFGIVGSFGVHFLGDECSSVGSRFSLGCMHLYAGGLILLFRSFAKRKYNLKKRDKSA